MVIPQIIVKRAGLVHLQDFRAQVRHRDAPVDRVGAVHRVFEHDVGIAALELDFSEGLKEFTRVDLLFADAFVVDHLGVFFGH